MRPIRVLTLVLLFSSWGQSPIFGQDKGTVTGTIAHIDTVGNVITIQRETGIDNAAGQAERDPVQVQIALMQKMQREAGFFRNKTGVITFQLAEKCVVTFDGRAVGLGALSTGQKVSITYAPGKLLASRVEATAAPVQQTGRRGPATAPAPERPPQPIAIPETRKREVLLKGPVSASILYTNGTKQVVTLLELSQEELVLRRGSIASETIKAVQVADGLYVRDPAQKRFVFSSNQQLAQKEREQQQLARPQIPPKTGLQPRPGTDREIKVPEQTPTSRPNKQPPIATGQKTETASTHPVEEQLTENDLGKMARKIVPADLPQYSMGRLAAFHAVIWTEFVFHYAGKRLTEDEFQAMVCYCVHRMFSPGGPFHDAPYSYDLKTVGLDAEFAAAVARLMEFYETVSDIRINHRKEFAENKHKPYNEYSQAEKVAKEGRPCRADQLVRELERYRSGGALPHNRPDLPPEEIVQGGKAFVRYELAPEQKFKVGDKVCSPGITLFWKGTILKIDGERYQVRIDYSNDVGPIRAKYRSTDPPVWLTRGEFVRLTRESVRSLIGGLLKH